MKPIYFLLAGSLALSLGACGHSGHKHDHGPHGNHDEHDGHEEVSEHHEHADGEIVVEPEMAHRFGVKTDTVRLASFCQSIKAAGTFISSSNSMASVSAPLSGTVKYPGNITTGTTVRRGTVVAMVTPGNVEGANANASAKAAMMAAKREVDRLKPLYDEHLVTAGEYNAALAAYEQARAAWSPAASGKVSAPISGVVTSVVLPAGSFAQAGEVLMQISSDAELTLKVDVPQTNYSQARESVDANVVMSDGRILKVSDLGGRRISAAGAGSTEASGFVPVYFSIPASAQIAPGSTAEVYLLSQSPSESLSIPRTALSEQQGSFFVYEKIGDHAYRRLPVSIGGSDGVNVEILSGLKGGEVLVTEAVTTIRLAENSGAIPEGHSHSH